MRLLSMVGFGLALGLLPGCTGQHAAPSGATAPAIVTPAQTAGAYVLKVEESGRFVILNFPGGQPLPVGRSMLLYRNGLETAEVKISGPQQDNNTAADILSGEARPGDEARAE